MTSFEWTKMNSLRLGNTWAKLKANWLAYYLFHRKLSKALNKVGGTYHHMLKDKCYSFCPWKEPHLRMRSPVGRYATALMNGEKSAAHGNLRLGSFAGLSMGPIVGVVCRKVGTGRWNCVGNAKHFDPNYRPLNNTSLLNTSSFCYLVKTQLVYLPILSLITWATFWNMLVFRVK